MKPHILAKHDAFLNAKDEQVIRAVCSCGAYVDADSFEAGSDWHRQHRAGKSQPSGFTKLGDVSVPNYKRRK